MQQEADRQPGQEPGLAGIGAISDEIDQIRAAGRDLEVAFEGALAAVDPRFRDSARNLLHYAALRRFDLRPLQAKLAALGLSSLGRSERHVVATLTAVQGVLQRLVSGTGASAVSVAEEFATSRQQLDSHASDMLGPRRAGRTARIMVTLPAEAATEPELVRQLIESGMDVARINCAHDSEPAWSAMIANVRRACAGAKRQCRVLMDLAGPKLRTGALAPGPKVLHIKPRHDPRGYVVAPKRLTLRAGKSTSVARPSVIPVSDARALKARPGDCFRLRDTRGKKRRLYVVGSGRQGIKVECFRSAYIATGTKLKLTRPGKGAMLTVRVGELPPAEQPILLKKGDELVLHRDARPGEPASIGANGVVERPAHISCTLPEVFRDVRAGEAVFLDDGKIGGTVKSVDENTMVILIDKARSNGSRLRGGKSINFPASNLHVAGLTDKDRRDLEFIVQHADSVGLSFVRQPEDVTVLQAALAKYEGRRPGIVLKIETGQAFNNLIALLLAAMRSYPAGVMIARGDLAIECGWERLAELQEEILWLCEAARLPVIWATQVLESTTKKGMPSRAEISDAAMSQRADCVMLNKGPHILDAIRMLDDILRRMQAHQSKKSARLRKLSITDFDDRPR